MDPRLRIKIRKDKLSNMTNRVMKLPQTDWLRQRPFDSNNTLQETRFFKDNENRNKDKTGVSYMASLKAKKRKRKKRRTVDRSPHTTKKKERRRSRKSKKKNNKPFQQPPVCTMQTNLFSTPSTRKGACPRLCCIPTIFM